MIRDTKDLLVLQTQTWADFQDFIQAIILDIIRDKIQATMEKMHGLRQDRHEGYADNWAVVAAELQSQASSKATKRPTHWIQNPHNWATGAAEQRSLESSEATKRPAHPIQTPSSWHIATLPEQQDSQNDLQDTDLSFEYCQTLSAAHVIRFFCSDTPSGDDCQEVPRGLMLNRTMSVTSSWRLSLNLDGIEPAQERTSDSEQGDVEQERNESVSESIYFMAVVIQKTSEYTKADRYDSENCV